MVMEVEGNYYLNFASNDYLGLGQQQDVLQSYVEGLSLHGAGSGASSVVSGYNKEHLALESFICEHTNKEAALLFSSGFAANQAICHALFASGFSKPQENLVISDKWMHASFVEAASSLQTPFKRFKHNDLEHLAYLLDSCPSNTLIASEGVFSMDGDEAPLSDMVNLLETSAFTNRPWLMVDDAHAIGVTGNSGMGSCDASNPDRDQIDIVMGTFGKAIGTSGAFVAGSQALIDFLLNFARHYVYSTAIPAAVAKATLTSFKLMRDSDSRNLLHQNIALFKHKCLSRGIPLTDSASAIQPIILGNPELTLNCSLSLKALGIWVGCIRTPTVPKHTDRLRITLSAMHQEKDINALVDALELSLKQNGFNSKTNGPTL
ncbi:8-amino-7-oxononanoate synthase [Glaciecola sp. KUL10]|nr:8-amino-7-oxononanoate synthase [Glaciecola sp. KUL10]